jgi:hypothetical protein
VLEHFQSRCTTGALSNEHASLTQSKRLWCSHLSSPVFRGIICIVIVSHGTRDTVERNRIGLHHFKAHLIYWLMRLTVVRTAREHIVLSVRGLAFSNSVRTTASCPQNTLRRNPHRFSAKTCLYDRYFWNIQSFFFRNDGDKYLLAYRM